ncbi:cilia- and flagella-associated protein 206-like [Paramacrobiotus metropolitanus]|uniref:cilia- and flagella-associated protein 206-like n=1 Tax=Paramacrobiotus metropolitanus TaxID=2943436 RepID=UPI002445BA33|nr:cilia- and flagella-associated protein 206-like [Paramacrobiotus metropolitanus]
MTTLRPGELSRTLRSPQIRYRLQPTRLTSNSFEMWSTSFKVSPDGLQRWRIKETVANRCKYNNSRLPPLLGEYLLQTVPPFELDENFSDSLVEKVIQDCQNKIDNHPFEVSAALLYFSVHNDVADKESFLKSLKQKKDAANRTALHDILTTLVTSSWDLDRLQKKVVNYVIQKSSLGSPNDTATVQDCAAALSSVWPNGSLEKFLYLTPAQKKLEVEDYLLLSTGVRLFNKAKRRSNAEITDVPEILKEQISSIAERLLSLMQEANEDKRLIRGYLLQLMHGKNPLQAEEFNVFKEILIFLEVYHDSLTLINNQVKESISVLEKSQQTFNRNVDMLESNCRNERLVAANVVLTDSIRENPINLQKPLFISMAQEWSSLQSELAWCEFLDKTVMNIQAKLQMWSDLKASRNLNSVLNVHVTPEESHKSIAADQFNTAEVRLLLKDTTPGFEAINVSLKGKCLTTLIDYNGLLFDGDKNLGLLHYSGEIFCFKSPSDALAFANDPAKYTSGMEEVFRNIPILSKLLRHNADFVCHSQESVFRTEQGINVDNSMQTVLHPIPSNIDKSYEWNIWSIRKKAYDVFRITQCSTHSSQTNFSAFKNECSMQTVMSPRNREIQTKVTTATAATRNIQFFSGLRGGPNAFNKTHFHQLDLTLSRPPIQLGDKQRSQAVCEVPSIATQVCEIPEPISSASLGSDRSSWTTVATSTTESGYSDEGGLGL